MRVVRIWNKGPDKWGISTFKEVQSPEQSDVIGCASSRGWGRDLQMSSPNALLCNAVKREPRGAEHFWVCKVGWDWLGTLPCIRFLPSWSYHPDKMTRPGLHAFSARFWLLMMADKTAADVLVASLRVSFSRAQRHACHHGLTWTGRGFGPAISMRTGGQILPCCSFLQCKHQPTTGSIWGAQILLLRRSNLPP